MEGEVKSIENQWPSSKCDITVVTADTGPVYQGAQSLYYPGSKGCILFRPIAPDCSPGRITEPIRAGDTLYISIMVRTKAKNKSFEMYTRHYHDAKGPRKWGITGDGSDLVSRTLIRTAEEWTRVEAVHVVGDDWKDHDGVIQEPAGCNHYHLRFRVSGNAPFWLDNLVIARVPADTIPGSPASGAVEAGANATSSPTSSPVPVIDIPRSGFFYNPNFELNTQYWKYASTMGHVTYDPDISANAMIMRRGRVLRQNVLARVVPAQKYQFGFWVSIRNVESIDFRIIMRMRFRNSAAPAGPCHKPICNFFIRPLARNVKANGGNWQQVITEEFDFFGNHTKLDPYGEVDFMLFQLLTRNLGVTAEYRVANFEVFEEAKTNAPSASMLPSSSPTNLIQQHVGYRVSYAGELRTVIRYPFQIDKTGEILSMAEAASYQLCEVDEVEGKGNEVRTQTDGYLLCAVLFL